MTPAGGVPGRCGYGPRSAALVISPFAKQNYVDHRVTDQSSILRFIEDNWELGRIGNGSLDEKTDTLNGLFDFDGGSKAGKLILDPGTGLPRVILFETRSRTGGTDKTEVPRAVQI